MPLGRRDFLAALGAGAAAACVRPESVVAPPALTVEVWHDTVCPWCRIGLHNLQQVVARREGPRVEVLLHPFLLDPDAPPEGTDLRAHLAGKFGGDPDRAFQRVTAFGNRFGVRFAWDRVRRMPSTTPSHALIEWAPRPSQAAIVEGLHRAYFEEGKDLGEAGVLAAIATGAGLEGDAARRAVTDAGRLEAIRRAARAASAGGITGVPFYRIGARTLSGAQAPEAIEAAIKAALEQA